MFRSFDDRTKFLLATRVLDAIEVAESSLIVWGVVDRFLTPQACLDLAQQVLSQPTTHFPAGAPPGEAEEVLEYLRQARMLFDLELEGTAYRCSRMAEGIRLMVNLRQMFNADDWQESPGLVSDFRFHLQPRRYPRRDFSPDEAFEALKEQQVSLLPGRRACLERLLTHGRQPLKLARFQIDAIATMLASASSGRAQGMVVGAGTGSGKTLAFYIPALVLISEWITRDGQEWTKCLAVYPRNELLNDQFTEAFSQARKLDELHHSDRRRPITIGCWYGPTPKNPEDAAKKWKKAGANYICPYMRCPYCSRSERVEMLWRAQDLVQKRERLVCAKNPDHIIDGDQIILTRDSIKKHPPDILFTTIETLNRRMIDMWSCHVVGVNASLQPRLVLMDEIHTYSGRYGASVGMLIRRWRAATYQQGTKPPFFAGLSATLEDAENFFASLTGLLPNNIHSIKPAEEDLEDEGMEYSLALRAQPVPPPSVLATTIQTSMLMRRLLDPLSSDEVSLGMAGQKLFVFTDDLDVTNRLYNDLQDAEKVNWKGKPRFGPRCPSLAALRSSLQEDPDKRLDQGQNWRICEEIGHGTGLTLPVHIARTSSQDAGVNAGAEVVVASPSLEVGFDDARVGAVLQHKAPRDMAAYLQRKGRAGRDRRMRPWMILALGDYGRDRMAYEAYETFLLPTIPPQVLPISNFYLRRIHATFALMEWLGHELRRRVNFRNESLKINAWMLLAQPTSADFRQQQQEAVKLLEEVLSSGPALLSLRRYLQQSLGVTDEQIESILYDPPRALVLEVVPTALRRLETDWRNEPPVKHPDQEGEIPPLPEFVPQSLFSDLNLPEVSIQANLLNGRVHTDVVPILQGLSMIAPGNATRRLAAYDPNGLHWVEPPSLVEAEQQMDLKEFVKGEELGEYWLTKDGSSIAVPCIRPHHAQMERRSTNEVAPSSRGSLRWHSQFISAVEGIRLSTPQGSRWAEIIEEITFHLHATRNPVDVRRFATGSQTSILFRERLARETGSSSLEARVDFVRDGAPCALGFRLEADGICFRIRVDSAMLLAKLSTARPKLIRALRSELFRHLVLTDDRLKPANRFARIWLADIFLASVAGLHSRDPQAPTHTIISKLTEDQALLKKAMNRALEGIYGAQSRPEEDDEALSEERNVNQQQLREKIGDPFVRQVLTENAQSLLELDTKRFGLRVAHRFASTLGEALLRACLLLYPEFVAEEVVMDIDPGLDGAGKQRVPEGYADIWITETSPGGVGILEEIAYRLRRNPNEFLRVLEAALAPSDLEFLDLELSRISSLLVEDDGIAALAAEFRGSVSAEDARRANEKLRVGLYDRNVATRHAVMSAMNLRLLRRRSSPTTDQLVADLLLTRERMEEALGFEVDLRTFCYLAAIQDDVGKALATIDRRKSSDAAWRIRTLASILWPWGGQIRASALRSYNPYCEMPPTDRLLVLAAVEPLHTTVSMEDSDWLPAVCCHLEAGRSVKLTAAASQIDQLRSAVMLLAITPIDVNYLQVYPKVDAILREVEGLSAMIRAELTSP